METFGLFQHPDSLICQLRSIVPEYGDVAQRTVFLDDELHDDRSLDTVSPGFCRIDDIRVEELFQGFSATRILRLLCGHVPHLVVGFAHVAGGVPTLIVSTSPGSGRLPHRAASFCSVLASVSRVLCVGHLNASHEDKQGQEGDGKKSFHSCIFMVKLIDWTNLFDGKR